MSVCAIICAAGKGARAGFDENKLLIPYGDSTVLKKTLTAFDFAKIDEIIVTSSETDFDQITALCVPFARTRVVLGGKEREVVRIACMNGGSTILKPAVDSRFLPKCVSVRFEPAELAPKQEGDMVVEYTPQGANEGTRSVKLYINGLNVAPRESTIEIVIGK